MIASGAKDAVFDRLNWTWSSPFLLAPVPASPTTTEQSAWVRQFFAAQLDQFTLEKISLPAESPRERLGHLFENTLHALLKSHPSTERVVRGLRFGNTGELDFLVFPKDRDSPVLHVEAAIKIYLCLDSGGSQSASRFVGPELKDSLDRKVAKLYSHQLRLLERPEIIGQIPELWVENRKCVSVPFAKGCLFIPGTLSGHEPPLLPQEIEPTAFTGIWMKPGDCLREWQSLPHANFRDLREKRFWVHSDEFAPRIERSEFQSRLESLQEPQLFAMECDKVRRRVFIVPEDWPAHAHQTRAHP